METETPEQEKKRLETVDIPGIEIFEEGIWNGDRYESKDIQAMLDAFDQVGFQPPVIRAKAKLGHADGQEDENKAREVFGAPALGHVSRIYKVGKKLLADLVKVPKRIAELIKVGAYDRVSAEIYWDYKDGNGGQKYPRVLKAISFLGADIPALTNLKAIESLYKKLPDGPAHVFEDNGNEFRAYCMDCSAGLIAPGMPFSDYLLRYPRKSKEDAGYGLSDDGQERCVNCKFWIGGYNACSIVEGWIEPDGVSDFYEARPGLAMMKKKEDDVREYTIEKRGDEYCLVSKSTGKTLGCHPTREKAAAQEAAIKANMEKVPDDFRITVQEMGELCPSCADEMKGSSVAELKFNGAKLRQYLDTTDPGLFTNCMEDDEMVERYPDDERRARVCAALHKKITGITPAEHRHQIKAKEYAMEVKQKDGQFCVMDGDKTVKCYPTQEEADAHVKKMSKGGPIMDERKFQEEQARLTAEKDAAEKKAKDYESELAALKAANEEAKGKESEALQEVKKLKRERHDDQVRSWIAAQKRAGKLAPVEESRLAAIFSVLYEDQRTVTFAQADGKESKEPLADAIKSFVVNRPSIFRELSHADGEPVESLPNAGDEIDRRAKEYQSKNKEAGYADACKAVLRADPELNERYMRIQN